MVNCVMRKMDCEKTKINSNNNNNERKKWIFNGQMSHDFGRKRGANFFSTIKCFHIKVVLKRKLMFFFQKKASMMMMMMMVIITMLNDINDDHS